MHLIDKNNEPNVWLSDFIFGRWLLLCCSEFNGVTHKINMFFPLFTGIYFRIIGYGKCSWTDLLRRDSVAVDGKGERSAIKYSGTEEYLNSTMYIIGSKNGNCFACLILIWIDLEAFIISIDSINESNTELSNYQITYINHSLIIST